MTKENKFFVWMVLIAVISMIVHYLILWIFKTDEPFFFLLSFTLVAAAITSWIFDIIGKKFKK